MPNLLTVPAGNNFATPTGQKFTVTNLWTPADITTEGWYDAADASTITESAGSVSQWSDKSGNNRHCTQPVGSAQPTISGTTIDFTSHWFLVDLDYLAGVSHSCFIVTKTDTYKEIYGALTGGMGSNSLHVGFDNNTKYKLNYWGDNYTPNISTAFNHGAENIVNYEWISGTTKRVYANGTLEGDSGSAGVIGTMAGGGTIGDARGTYYDGQIREFIVLTGTVSTDDRQRIEGYLAHKWGKLADLPIGHPYRLAPPII